MHNALNNQDNGEVTNSELARMITEGFTDISARMATKDEYTSYKVTNLPIGSCTSIVRLIAGG